ncbi:Gm13103 [Phodopus roborovskii]|uniref:Gm13103 protein n=1 Tax=Phodopus roborovskii TaxID=109678 RepID=A0AAU9ZVA2_PHORO|nr:Gm13103 [Phodopus roborovskii]
MVLSRQGCSLAIFPGPNKMSIRTLPTLEKLARKALLRDEALAISALEDLPKRFFLPLFQEAFSCRLRRIVRAMVAAWPFSYFPVAVLMDTCNWDFFRAVIEGLRALLRQHDHPMRGNLRILDFRRVHRDVWTIEAGTEDGDCSAETVSEKQAVKPPPRYEQRHRVKRCWKSPSTKLGELLHVSLLTSFR